MTAARAQKIRSISRPAASIVEVTPKLAEEWLAGNTVNRNVRIDAVNQYASDMLAGRWTVSESAICFSPDGKLLNGQHRLNAVIAADVAVPMLVLRNVPTDAMTNMDSGRKRTVSDALGFDGEVNTAALAAAAKLALLYSDGRLYKDRKVQAVSTGEIREFIADNPDLRESTSFMYSIGRSIDLSPSVKIVAHWLFTRAAEPTSADLFFDALASRIGLSAGSPILALDSRIREMRRNGTRAGQRDQLRLLIKAWNYWRAGRTVRTLAVASKSADALLPAVSA